MANERGTKRGPYNLHRVHDNYPVPRESQRRHNQAENQAEENDEIMDEDEPLNELGIAVNEEAEDRQQIQEGPEPALGSDDAEDVAEATPHVFEEMYEDAGDDQLPEEPEEPEDVRTLFEDEKYTRAINEHSDVSVLSFIYKISLLFYKHKLTKSCLKDILKLVNELLPQPSYVPKSLYLYQKFIKEISPINGQYKKVNYCGNEPCQHIIEDDKMLEDCEVCASKEKCYSLEFPTDLIIKHMLEKRNLATILEREAQSRQRVDGVYRDICDGDAFKKLHDQCSVYDVVLLGNTDAYRTSENSPVQAWPKFHTIANISESLRGKFIILSGIWFGKFKPKMNSFMKPTVDSIVKLGSEGLEWTHPTTGAKHRSYATLGLMSVDAPARCALQNLQQYNAFYGCSFCEQPAESVPCGLGSSRIFRYVEDMTIRTNSAMLQQAQESVETGTPVMGVKGPSVLSEVPEFDLSDGFVPEYLHNVCLGEVRRMTKCWFDLSYRHKPFYIGNFLEEMDKILLSITTPSNIRRPPRSLAELHMWKGSELRHFLLYYSLFVLRNYLPKKYFDHWMLYVTAITLVNSDHVTEHDIEVASMLFHLFCEETERLYGATELTFNHHCTLHITRSVRNWGPIHGVAAFVFENENGVLQVILHGTNNIEIELANNMDIIMALQTLQGVCDIIDYDLRLRSKVLGRCVSRQMFSTQQKEAINQFEANHGEVSLFLRARVNNTIYASEVYVRSKRRSDSLVLLKSDEYAHLGFLIICFFKDDDSIISCMCHPLSNVLPAFTHDATGSNVPHIFKYEVDRSKIAVFNVDSFISPLIKIEDCFCVQPNMTEINL